MNKEDFSLNNHNLNDYKKSYDELILQKEASFSKIEYLQKTYNNIEKQIQMDKSNINNQHQLRSNTNQSKQISNVIEISELELGHILTSKDIFDAKKRIMDKYKDKRFYNIEIQDSKTPHEM